MIKRNLRKAGVNILFLMILAFVCIGDIHSDTAFAEGTAAATASNNTGDQSYTTYHATQPYSYLTETDSGFMRVEYVSGSIVVEYYDSDYNLVSAQSVDMELSYFGGFYAGEDAYYLVFGQSNTAEDDSVEVVRVVKYSTDWERAGAASLYGANTYIPFDAGSCRMTEYGGYLYIRTSHEMYLSSDGYHHQANLTIQVQESDMTVADSYYSVMNVSVGYVSHSFNQFILVDDAANLIALDHGDAYPRAAVLLKYAKQAGSSSFSGSASSVNLLTFEGDTGDNWTGASLGGLEYSSTSYLVAGNSVTQDDTWSSHTARNVYVAVTSRSDFSSSGTEVKWITNYDTDGTVTASTPQLVKLGSDSFLLIWTTTEYENSSVTYSKMTKLHYVYLDGEGNTTSDIYTVDGQLSDCQPIVLNGTVVWYVTGDSSSYGSSVSTTPVFYSISSDGTFSVHSDMEAPENVRVETSSGSLEVSWDAVEGAEGYYVYLAYSGTSSKITVSDGGTTSTTISSSNGTLFYVWVEAYSGDAKSLAQNKQEVMIPGAAAASDGIQLTWGAMSNAESYQIYQKNEDGTYSLVLTTTDTSWTDTSVCSGKSYTYKVTVQRNDGSSYETCDVSVYYLDTPDLVSISNTKSSVQLTWETVEGASLYYFYFTSTSSPYTTYIDFATAGSGETQTATCRYTLSSGNTYTFYVKAYNADEAQYSSASDKLSIYYLTAPSVTVAGDGECASLTWSAITGADGYYIYKKTGLGDYELLQTTAEVTYTDSSVSEDNLYTYQVFAYYGDERSAGSTEVYWGTADMNDCEITLSQTEYTYNGYSKRPTVTVKYGSQTLTNSTDYTVSYVNNVYPGTATVSVTGSGCFTGTATLNFTINKAANTLSASIADAELVFGDTTSITASGNGTKTYESGDTAVATVSSKGVVTAVGVGTTVITVKAAGNTYYEAGSISLDISVNPRDLSDSSITLNQTSYSYDGTVKNPGVTLVCNSVTLTQDTDYTVTYSGSKNVGTYTVSVTGTGNYTGTASAMYTISQTDLSDCTVSLSQNKYTYDGTEKKPTVTVSMGSVALLEGTDYTVSYSNNVDAGTAEVTVTGMENCTGTQTVSYSISRAEISGYALTLSEDTFTYDGTAKTPSVTVGNGSAVLTENADYTVAYTSNTAVGTGTVSVTGTGNYTGVLSKEFTIEAIDISRCTVTLSEESHTYDGTAKKPSVIVTDGATALTAGTDYTVTYKDNVNAGTAAVVITGRGNYRSTVEKEFVIQAISMAGYTMTLSAGSYIYDGTEKKPVVIVSSGETVLTEGTDYTVTYTDNVNAGEATVTVMGQGNYQGSISASFEIAKADQSIELSVSATDVAVNGTATIKAAASEASFTAGSSAESIATVVGAENEADTFTVTGVGVGTATITITTSGVNYNQVSQSFEITVTEEGTERISLSECQVSLASDSCAYDGTEQEPTVTVTHANEALKGNEDYTVTYENNVNAGTAIALVKGMGEYTGLVTKTFTIAKGTRDIGAAVSASEIAVGSTAQITVATETQLTYCSDNSSVASVDSSGKIVGISAGTAVITVYADETENYLAASETFTISVKEDISGCEITLSETDFAYDGTAKMPDVVVTDGAASLTRDDKGQGDYTVSYSNNTKVGTATVTITGTGNYTGRTERTFSINKGSQTISGTAAYSKTYGNAAFMLDAKTSGDGALSYASSNKDVVTVSSAGVVTIQAAGSATITVTAEASTNYNESAAKTIAITVAKANQTITATAASSSIKVDTTTTITASGTGTITYTSSDTSVATVDSSGKVTAKAKGTATITVKAAGNSNYNAATKTVTITVTALAKGDAFTSRSVKYKLTSASAVTVTGLSSKTATSATIPNTVTYGGVTYNVTAINASAFSGYTKLKTVSVGSKVKSIGSKAFYKCTALTRVTGCTAVTSVGSSAFQGCSKLATVKGLQKATSIGSKAFYGCTKLKTIGSSSGKITLAKVKTIGSSAFYKCTTLTYVNLTSTALTKIGTSAFQGCTALKTFVSRSTKLATIGKKAFYGDKKLASITLKTTKLTSSKVGASAFKGIKTTCTFKVPSAKISAYKKLFKAKGAGSKITVKKG